MIGKRVGDPCPHCTNAVLLKRRDYFGGFYVWCIMCNRRWVLLEDGGGSDTFRERESAGLVEIRSAKSLPGERSRNEKPAIS